jgi:hypothetical protein
VPFFILEDGDLKKGQLLKAFDASGLRSAIFLNDAHRA